MSAVYCYFDPQVARLSLGTFSILQQLALCRLWGFEYLYLGYYIDEPCRIEWRTEDIPAEHRPAVEEALRHGLDSGPRFGFPLVGARLRVVGGGSDPVRNSEMAFSQAASQALREAVAAADVQLLEPVMAFEIQAPDEFMSGIIGHLNASGAEIADVRQEGPVRTVSGVVPLVHMFGYSTTLRSLSQGRASFSMSPAGFRPVGEADLRERGLVWQ